MDKTEVQMPVAKLSASIGTVTVAKAEELKTVAELGIMSLDLFTLTWSNIASALAAIFTLSMLAEFWWKKFWRPLALRKGWMKEPPLQLTPEERRKVLRERRLAELEAQDEAGR